MVKNDPAKDWGLPDWRDADSYANSYGRPDQWSDDRWRWEFKRRLSSYRIAFDKYVEQGRHGSIVQDHIEKFDDDGNRVMAEPSDTEAVSVEHSDQLGFMFVADEEERAKFGMYFLPNPRFSEQPNRTLLFGDRIFTSQRDEEGLLFGEVTYRFDLMEPLAPQIARCKVLLKFHQGQLEEAKVQRRWYRHFFLEYLQALDAREYKASYDDIPIFIPLNKKTKDAARALVKQARQVRDNF